MISIESSKLSMKKDKFRNIDKNSPLWRDLERQEMTTYDNTNSGILTKNDKGDNEKRPDYRGSINVGGVDYWLSAWIKEGRDGTKLEGQKYLSLSVEPKEAAKETAPAKPKVSSPDDDIPF